MSPARLFFRFEPQEYAHALLYLCVLARLSLAGALLSLPGAIFAAMLAGAVVVIHRCRANPTSGRWTIRRWYFLATMPVAYWTMTSAVAVIGVNRAAWLRAADHWMLDMDIETRLAPLLRPWLTEVLSFAYIAFFPFIAYGLITNARELGRRSANILRVFGTLYGLGFLGYTLVPAAGPYLEGTASAADLAAGIGATLNNFMVHEGSNRVDCFPSLHCAISGAIFYFDWHYARRRAWASGLVTAAIWLSTVYLRQHYFVDVVSGAALLICVLLIVFHWPLHPSEHSLGGEEHTPPGDP